ncbi:glycosyltransferase [Candidatus Viadribacter manganicus]|uniref:Glycosyl transferase family 2 n=1 Tax=Candidatus Viadribacter manganicus TaxID=1759059 RepID=A0A1B1AJU2_9PROT|nr:glycosyltransferase [Candidatus Viadribacter manganicus]ANP46827.1 glycosyl transferase family 2 [Candidatus Viadribacter manganicus]
MDTALAPARLAVVVGTLNRLDQIKRCIDSIRRETRTPTIIYVTDAGSTDGTVEYLRQAAAPDLVPLLVGKKLGQAKAYNDVFRTIATPYVVWLSDDNEIVNNGLDTAVAILERDARIGMVGLKTRDKEGPFAKAPYIGGISKAGILNVNQGVLPTSVLRDVDYFSETFGFYGIDPDLTAKVLFSGRDVVYTRDVAIHHYRNWPADQNAPEWVALRAHHEKAERLYLAKYGAFGRFDVFYRLRRGAWKAYREALGPRFKINSAEAGAAGLLTRDWHNTIASRHISLLDPWLTRGKPYHLRQSASPLARPRQLPPDPDPALLAAS